MDNCLICKSNTSVPLFGLHDQYGDHFNWSVCNSCGANFLDPSPTKDQLYRAYANEYYGEGSKKFNSTVEKVLDQFRSAKAASLAKHLDTNAKILDIGCADGEFLHQLSKFGKFQLHGVELEGKAAQRAKERGGIELHVGALQVDSYSDESFDLISIVHVFEHLPDPVQSLEIISKMIKKGGLVYLEQPNIGSWQAKFFKGNWLHLDPPRHIHLLRDQQIIELMSDRGFELISKNYFSPQFNPFGVQQSILNLLLKKREVLYEHLKGNHSYTKEYSALNLWIQKLFHWFSFPLFVFTDMLASAFGQGGTMKLLFRKREDGGRKTEDKR